MGGIQNARHATMQHCLATEHCPKSCLASLLLDCLPWKNVHERVRLTQSGLWSAGWAPARILDQRKTDPSRAERIVRSGGASRLNAGSRRAEPKAQFKATPRRI